MKITVYGYWLRQALDYKSSIKFNWTWWLEPRVQLDILSSYKRQPFKSLSRSLWLRYLVQSTSLRRPCFEATYKCAIVKVGWSHHRKPNLLSEALCNLRFKWISKTNFSLEQIGLCLKKSLFAWLWIPPRFTDPTKSRETNTSHPSIMTPRRKNKTLKCVFVWLKWAYMSCHKPFMISGSSGG